MAKLEIRRRGETGGGVLPQVRQVDYSGIGNNALTRYQAQGGMGTDIQNAVKGIAHGLDQTVGVLNARDERDATLLAAKMQSNLANEKAKFLLEIERNPTLADSAVDRWGEIVKKQQSDMVKELGGGQDSYRRECFKRATQTFLDNNAIEVLRTSSKIADKYNQDVASAGLDLAMQNLVDAPEATQEEAAEELSRQFFAAANAYRWSAEEKLLKWEQLIEKTGEARANRAISAAGTVAQLDVIDGAISSIGKADATDEQKKVLKEIFGNISADEITPEKRVALQDAIRRRRANLVQVQSGYVTGLEAQYLEGKVDLKGLVDARNKMYDKEGKPIADISSINRLDKLIATAQTKADNEAVESFMVNVVRTNPDDKTLDILAAALPATVRDSLRVANFVAQTKAGNAKAAYEAEQEARRIQLDQVVYNSGAVKMSLQERQTKLKQMFAEGRLTGDQWKQAQDKIKVESDVRTRDIAVTALKMAEGGLWGAEHVIRFDANGYDMRGTSTQAEKRNKGYGETFAKVFDEYYTEWVKLVNNNPSWTEEECKKSFFTTMKPVLDAYTEAALEFKGKKWTNARATLNRLRALNTLDEKRKGWDMSVDDIGKDPLNIEFKPVGGNRSKK